MAQSGTWASHGQGRKRGFDEVPSNGYRDLLNEQPLNLRPVGPGPCQEHLDRFAMIPHTCEQYGTQAANTIATDQAHVTQLPIIGPAAQPKPFPIMDDGASTIPGGPVIFGQLGSTLTPFLYAIPSYWAPQIPWNQRQVYPLPMYDASVAMNATYGTSGSHVGSSSATGYPGILTAQNETGYSNPSPTTSHLEPSRQSTRPLHIAPRPSLLPHVPIKETPAGIMGCIGRGTRRRFDSKGLAKVNEVRQNGACLRCRLYKLSCDKGQPCAPCKKVLGSTKVHRGPCINPRLDTVQAFRAGDGDNRTVVPTLPNLKWVQVGRSRPGAAFRPVNQAQPRPTEDLMSSMTIEVTWPFSADIAPEPPVARIDLHRFEPAGQYLAEEWTPLDGGPTRMVELPPLACKDTDTASTTIGAFLDECQILLERQISRMLDDPMMRATWREVLRIRDQSQDSTLKKVVRLYASVLMNTRYPKSVRANIFDVAEEPEPPFFFEGNLLPPQLTYQIQMLIAMEQTKLQKDVIRRLKQLMFNTQRQEYWYIVFLITFVLLSAIELMHYNQTSFLHYKRQNSETNRENVSYVTRHMLEQWEDSAENLISHFRFVMNGHMLFSQPGSAFRKNMAKASAHLDKGAVDYVMEMRGETQRRAAELARARKSRTGGGERKDMWAVCELFLSDDVEVPE